MDEYNNKEIELKKFCIEAALKTNKLNDAGVYEQVDILEAAKAYYDWIKEE